MAKDKLTPAEPATTPEVVNAVTGTDVLAGNPVVVAPAVAEEGTEIVQTGVDIRTGKPVVKAVPVKKAASVKWNTGDRAPYTVHLAGEGSLNGRSFNFKAGETINLNADEAKLFNAHVTKVAK